jgi:hypothetical protein
MGIWCPAAIVRPSIGSTTRNQPQPPRNQKRLRLFSGNA